MQNVQVLAEPFEYEGFAVVTTKQVAELFLCTRQVVDGVFRNHKDEFILGADYFKLTGAELKAFKNRFSRQISFSGGSQVAFSASASSLYIWTKTGVFKLAEYVGSERAKMVYAGLSMAYFHSNESKTPEQIPLLRTHEKAAPMQKETSAQINPPNNFEKAQLLIKAAELTTDKNLRDKIISLAFEMIKA